MLAIAREQNAHLSALKLSDDVKRQLPAWYHLGTPTGRQTLVSKCLQSTHGATTIGHLSDISKRLTRTQGPHRHAAWRRCECRDCAADAEAGCDNPHRCATKAKEVLDHLNPKLNPSNASPPDDLTLTHHRLRRNEDARTTHDVILFDPSVACKTSITDCFRIFTDPGSLSLPPATRLARPAEGTATPVTITIHVKGICRNAGLQDAHSGGGVWIAPDHIGNKSLRVAGSAQTATAGALSAIISALQSIADYIP
ncbi:hypothetical protein FA95DRAFT_1491659, partial [Auriscalpium vulgare]